jgi:hypothetical protein
LSAPDQNATLCQIEMTPPAEFSGDGVTFGLINDRRLTAKAVARRSVHTSRR